MKESIYLGLTEGENGENENKEAEEPKNIIERAEMTVKINQDGTANVAEVWTTDSKTGTDFSKRYEKLEKKNISNLSVTDETGVKYEVLPEWNKDADREAKKNKCGVYEEDNVTYICWGIGDYGEHKYTIRYNLPCIIQEYDDYELLYFTFMHDNIDPAPQKGKVVIYADFDLDEKQIELDGYGYIGKSEIKNGMAMFETMGGLEQIEYMQIYMKFNDKPFKDVHNKVIVDLDTIMSLPEAEPEPEVVEPFKMPWYGYIGIGVLGILLIIGLIFLAKFIKRKLKQRRRRKVREANENAKK